MLNLSSIDLSDAPGERRGILALALRPRAGVLAAAVVLALLVILNLVLYAISVSSAKHVLAGSPDLVQAIRAQARIQLLMIVVATAVFLAAVVAIGVLEGHRTAGAARKLARSMARIEQGRYDVELRLRREDHLQEVQAAFNQMTRALRDRLWHEVETLERLAARAAQAPTPEQAQRIGLEIRELAARMRRAVG